MGLIYLLLMLDSITNFFATIGIFALIIWGVTAILSLVGESCKDNRYSDWDEKSVTLVKGIRNTMLKIWIPFLALGLFLPNSKQAAIIFSVGQTIEYVKGNEKIKELPDRAILCLDKLISEYLEEEPVSNDTCN